MFRNADWTHPQTGGLLSQVIQKEEKQLREEKPPHEVKHIWNEDGLAERESSWYEVVPRKEHEDALGDLEKTRAKLGMSVPEAPGGVPRHSRTRMLDARRTTDQVDALRRQQQAEAERKGDDSPSKLDRFTPQLVQTLRPTYTTNEVYSTQTTNQLIGLGAAQMTADPPLHGLEKSEFREMIVSRNDPSRGLLEATLASTRRLAAEPMPVPKLHH